MADDNLGNFGSFDDGSASDDSLRDFGDGKNSQPSENKHIESESGSDVSSSVSSGAKDLSHDDRDEQEEQSAIDDVIEDIKKDIDDNIKKEQQSDELEDDGLEDVFADNGSEDDSEESEEDDSRDEDSPILGDPQSAKEEDGKDKSAGKFQVSPKVKPDKKSGDKPDNKDKDLKDGKSSGKKGQENREDKKPENLESAKSPDSQDNKNYPTGKTKGTPQREKQQENIKNSGQQGKPAAQQSDRQNREPEKESQPVSSKEDNAPIRDSNKSQQPGKSHKDRLKDKAARNAKPDVTPEGKKGQEKDSKKDPFSLAQKQAQSKNNTPDFRKNDSGDFQGENNPFKITQPTGRKGIPAGLAGAAGLTGADDNLSGAAKGKIPGKVTRPSSRKGENRDDSQQAEHLGEGVAASRRRQTDEFNKLSGDFAVKQSGVEGGQETSTRADHQGLVPNEEPAADDKKSKWPWLIAILILAMMLGGPLAMMGGIGTVVPSSNLIQDEDPMKCDPEDHDSVGNSGNGGGPSLGDVGDVTIPAAGLFSSGFGPRWGTIHKGVDIANAENTPIYAAHSGTVISSGTASGYGIWLRIQSDSDPSLVSIYGHQNRNHVNVGDKVKAGDHVADMGNLGFSTGTHLHFQVEKNGVAFDPVPWFRGEGLNFPNEGGQVELEGNASGGSSGRSSGGSSGGIDDSRSNNESNTSSKTYIIGDSLTEGAKGKIKDKLPGADIDSKVGRQYGEGLKILKDNNSEYDTVIMALGTNGAFSQGDIDDTLEAAEDAQVVLMTVGGPNVSSAGAVNSLVKGNSSKVNIADWEKEVNDNPDYIGGDGVHPTEKGQEAFAELIAKAAGGSSSDTKTSSAVGCVCEAGGGSASSGGSPGAAAAGGDVESRIAQYAPIVIAAGEELGMSENDIITALMVVLVESWGWKNWANDGSNSGQAGALNDDYTSEIGRSVEMANDGIATDANSVGLFQQQVSRKWGRVDDLMKPAYQAGRFYVEMSNLGLSNSGNPGLAAADIQRPREDLRYKYAEQEGEARRIYSDHKGNASLTSEEKEAARKAWDDYANGGSPSGDGGSTRGPSGHANCGTRGGSSSGDGEMDGVIDGSESGDIAKEAAKIALKQVGKDYVWGANGPNAFDCSGLLDYAYKQAGLQSIKKSGMRFTTYNIPDFSKEVKSKEDLAVGDAIITNGRGHVLMYVGDGMAVEALTSGVPVKKTPLSEVSGIVSMHRFVDKDNKELA